MCTPVALIAQGYSAFVAEEQGLRLPDDAADIDAVPVLLRRFCIL
jgi:hypothetical protein